MLGVAQPTIALPGLAKNTAAKAGKRCDHVTAQSARAFVDAVWDRDRWQRGKPHRREVRAYRHKLRCAAGAGHRRAIENHWGRERLRYGRYRHRQQVLADYLDAITPPGAATLEAIAACESGGDPAAVSSNGSYRGKYQFDYETWASVGGSGDPAAAPEREQDERAARLYRERGSQPWPVCGL